MRIHTGKFLTKGKSLILAYDQGLEHGPTDFNEKNMDPSYILDIALEGHFSGVIMHHGIAEKYHHGAFRDVPLIVKLNGKTRVPQFNPKRKDICTVERAIKVGANAIGYTLFDGKPMHEDTYYNFGKVVEQAHDYGLPVFCWVYPRDVSVKGRLMKTDMQAYAARVALEFGADFIKMRYNEDHKGFPWVVKNAGKAKILIAGGDKLTDKQFLEHTHQMMQSGVAGLAVGRNVWQNDHPLQFAKALRKVVFDKASVQEALQAMHF